jgi:hypothetical protein
VSGVIDEAARTITVQNIPLYTDETKTAVTNLKNIAPGISHTGASISPASGAQDFSGLVKTYTVTAEDGSTADYTVFVSIAPLEPANIATEINAWLSLAAAVYGGSSAAAPIPLPVKITLSSGWTSLLSAIYTGGKFVALDLSACAMTGEFDPVSSNSTGKNRIVSLVLPDGATRVKAGADFLTAAFRNFTALTSVAGANITSIGEFAFWGCTGLTTVDLSAATFIEEFAFFATGTKTLTVTLGAAVPTLGTRMFGVSLTKNVTVKVPSGAAAWNGLTGSYNETSSYTDNWGNGFRGGGWTGSAFQSGGASNVNSNINLTITEISP